jgi:hypothetical protein
MRANNFLRVMLFGALLAGCGDTAGGNNTFTPDDVAEDVDDAAVVDDVVEDFGSMPAFDVPVDISTQPDVPATIDRPSTTDAPIGVDRVTPTDTPRPPDTSMPGMCPSSCSSDGQCGGCATPGDPGNYCCISGLCLYMTGACAAPVPDGGGAGGDGGGGDGGGDGGLDDAAGADASAGADAATG